MPLLATKLGNSNCALARTPTAGDCLFCVCHKDWNTILDSPPSYCVWGEISPGRVEEMSNPEAPCPGEWRTWWPPPGLTPQQWLPPCCQALSVLWQAHRQAAGDAQHPRSAAEELRGLQSPQSCRWRWCLSVCRTQTALVLAAAGCCGLAWSAGSPVRYHKCLQHSFQMQVRAVLGCRCLAAGVLLQSVHESSK